MSDWALVPYGGQHVEIIHVQIIRDGFNTNTCYTLDSSHICPICVFSLQEDPVWRAWSTGNARNGRLVMLRSCRLCPLGFSVFYRSPISSASNQSRASPLFVRALTKEKEAAWKTARSKTEPFTYLCKADLNKVSLH